MGSSDLVDFEKASEGIIATLKDRSSHLDELDNVIKYIYNEAIDDAANFTRDMANSNPRQRVAYVSLEKELRHWLRLR
jgi:hypothetical protein